MFFNKLLNWCATQICKHTLLTDINTNIAYWNLKLSEKNFKLVKMYLNVKRECNIYVKLIKDCKEEFIKNEKYCFLFKTK